MSRGYLVMAQGPYTKQAEYLAQSIRSTQSEVRAISVITNSDIDSVLFDHVIPLAGEDLAKDAEWKIHNRARFLELTPYDETVILDADMLFLSDVSHWWTHLGMHELLLTSHVRTYRNNLVINSPYRRTFQENDLPNVYSAFTYFKRTSLTQDFFALVKSIIQNWNTWSQIYTPEHKQPWPSIDVAMAIAVKILDIENIATTTRPYPTFTHMKSGCQGWTVYSEDWTELVHTHVGEQYLRIGGYQQNGILHYVKKDFVTDEIMSIFK
jgi:hypothetical protein